MKDINDLSETKLDRIISIRFTLDDYDKLFRISRERGSNVSEVVRTVMRLLMNLNEKNNIKIN